MRRKGTSIKLVAKLILLLVFTCDGRTINDCSDFVSVKVWKYRRQLLVHRSNVWVREVAAWESPHSYAYVLREVTEGSRSYQAIFDENMILRTCQVMESYTEDGNSRLISDMRHECRQNETALSNLELPANLFETLLRANRHTEDTFDEIVNILDGEGVGYMKVNDSSSSAKSEGDSAVGDDRIRVADEPSDGDDAPSIEIYRKIGTSIPGGLEKYLEIQSAIEECNKHNEEFTKADGVLAAPYTLTSLLPKLIRDALSSIRRQMEIIGVLDPKQEDEEEDDDDDHVEGNSHHERRKRGLFMFPGTLWCGTGYRAPDQHSLGLYNRTDMCCRDHDQIAVNMTIAGWETKYYFKNRAIYTISHCSLDKRFHKCLRQVKNTAAYEVGRGFFNVFNVQCFVIRNRKQCTKRYWYKPWKCKAHEYLPTACLRKAQIFPSQKYVWPS